MSKPKAHVIGWAVVLAVAGVGAALAASPEDLPPDCQIVELAPDTDVAVCLVEESPTTTTEPATTTTTLPPSTTTTVPPTTTTLPPATTTAPPSEATQLTGSVCGTLTEDTQLVGEVTLCGDLIVSGATLFMRPGVQVIGDGFQIMLMEGAVADWQGTPTDTWEINPNDDPNVIGDETIQNLERDINIDNVGRLMFHEGAAPPNIRYVSVTNSGVLGVEGFYCFHFHLNGPSTVGGLLEGTVVENCANHAYVPHGSDGITFKDTIAFNTVSDAYWWDPGQDINDPDNIVYDHALAHTVRSSREAGGPRGGHHRNSAFALRGGVGHEVTNSAAINISGGADCSGFHWPESTGSPAVWLFEDNISFSENCNGIFVWQNDDEPHVITNFIGSKIHHGAYRNAYLYENVTVPALELNATSREGLQLRFINSSLGDITLSEGVQAGDPTIMDNVMIDSITVADGPNGAPKILHITNTNLTCAGVSFPNPHPDTEVWIDGQEC